MKTPLKQVEFLEVLIEEVESIKNEKKEHQKIYQKTQEQIDRLEKMFETPISVDLTNLKEEHDRIKSTLKQSFRIPKWLFYYSILVSILASISLFFNKKKLDENRSLQKIISYDR